LDRSLATDFSIACASSNLLRPVFARTFRDYRKLPVRVKVIRVDFADTHIPFACSPASGIAGEGGGGAPNFKRPNPRVQTDDTRRGATGRPWEFAGQKSTCFPICNGLFCLAYRWPSGTTTVEQTRFAHHYGWGKNTHQRSPATASYLNHSIMPDRKPQIT
jgi:hypothetical protein